MARNRLAAFVRSTSASSKNSFSPSVPAASEGSDLLVVVGAAGQRLVEDRRVRRQAGDGKVGDVSRERPARQERAGDVVEPQALAGVVQSCCRVHAAFPFEVEHLAEPAQVSLLGARHRVHERVDDLGRDRGAHDACAEREHVDVVVLDHLMAGVVVRRVRGPDPRQLVGGDGDARPAAAHEDAAFGVGGVERVGHSLGDERVVDALGRRGVRSVEKGLVPGGADGVGDRRPQRQPGMVGGDRDLHHRAAYERCREVSRSLARTRRGSRRRCRPPAGRFRGP